MSLDPLHQMPCMRCGQGRWEVLWDDGVMEYALCKPCVKICEAEEKEAKE